MTSGIYCIINLMNNMLYVGHSINIKARWTEHRYYLNNNNHDNPHLQSSWNKYGGDFFGFDILEIVKDVSKLEEREKYWIEKTKSSERGVGYNICLSGNSPLGLKRTEEQKARMRGPKSLKTRAKMSAWQIGKKHSEATKEKMRQARIGKKHSLEAKAKIAEASRTRIVSEDTKIKLALIHKGKPKSTEHKNKISEGVTEYHRLKHAAP